MAMVSMNIRTRASGLISAPFAAVLAALLVAGAVLGAGCGKANTASVTFKGMQLDPSTITVAVGTTVTWTNNDPEPETVTSDNNANVPDTSLYSSPSPGPGGFNSGPIDPGKSYSYTFTTPGTYKYSSIIHGYITGVVIVR